MNKRKELISVIVGLLIIIVVGYFLFTLRNCYVE